MDYVQYCVLSTEQWATKPRWRTSHSSPFESSVNLKTLFYIVLCKSVADKWPSFTWARYAGKGEDFQGLN